MNQLQLIKDNIMHSVIFEALDKIFGSKTSADSQATDWLGALTILTFSSHSHGIRYAYTPNIAL